MIRVYTTQCNWTDPATACQRCVQPGRRHCWQGVYKWRWWTSLLAGPPGLPAAHRRPAAGPSGCWGSPSDSCVGPSASSSPETSDNTHWSYVDGIYTRSTDHSAGAVIGMACSIAFIMAAIVALFYNVVQIAATICIFVVISYSRWFLW